ncbi:unnamed protein product [Parnassius apollo]|uniref:(apollo) hypothetical protein n=1 Tax=Parnassius apollo TaxID=110799 RepID=A0A8S3WNC7_PARAO|nr:unnamed protein product [Parnassius apollo]
MWKKLQKRNSSTKKTENTKKEKREQKPPTPKNTNEKCICNNIELERPEQRKTRLESLRQYESQVHASQSQEERSHNHKSERAVFSTCVNMTLKKDLHSQKKNGP